MIYSLRGTLIHCEPTIAVVECGGVGYMCLIPLSTYTRLTPVGSEIMLFTYMNVRQDAVDLFGFSTREEMNTFKLLTTVSGVGAKAGLAILSELTPEAVTLAIVGGDEKSFTRCAGIGKKIAARIVLELRDKFKGVDLSGAVSRKDSNSFDAVGGSAMAEA
ncbi:MAG: Holliday junction branch migration protein RuvA, partial [Oscillospiraceae bacterium]